MRIVSLFGVAGLFGATSAADAFTVTTATRTVLIGAAAQAPTPAITQPPDISQTEYALGKRGNSGVIGVFPWPDERAGPNWETRYCPSNSYFATGFNGRYGMCCNPSTASCMSVTSCGASGTAYGPGSFWAGCATDQLCETVTVFESKGSPTSYYYLGCSVPGDSSFVSKLYRQGFTFSRTSVTRTTTATLVTTKTVSRNHGSRSIPMPVVLELLLRVLDYMVGLAALVA